MTPFHSLFCSSHQWLISLKSNPSPPVPYEDALGRPASRAESSALPDLAQHQTCWGHCSHSSLSPTCSQPQRCRHLGPNDSFFWRGRGLSYVLRSIWQCSWLLPRNARNIHPHQVVTTENVSGRYQMSLGWQKSHLTESHRST